MLCQIQAARNRLGHTHDQDAAEIMNSVPGVGVATIAMLLSECPSWEDSIAARTLDGS